MKSKIAANLFKLLIATALSGQAYASTDPSPDCLQNLASIPALLIINEKVAIGREQTIEMLSNREKPTQEEKKGISLWMIERDKCMESGERWRAANSPAKLNARINTFASDLKSLAARLYGEELTYGEFARKRADITTIFENESTEIFQESMNRQTEQASQERRLQLQEESLAQRNYVNNQRPITPIQMQPYMLPFTPMQIQPYQPRTVPQATTTRCQQIGNQFVCNSN